MKTVWKVVIGVVVAVVLVFGLFIGMALISRLIRFPASASVYRYGVSPRTMGPGVYGVIPFTMGPGYAGRGMLGTGFGGWMGIGLVMLGRLLFPLLLLALVIGLVVALMRRPAPHIAPVQATASPVMAGTCSSCGRPLQADWSVCPYCGQKIKPGGAV